MSTWRIDGPGPGTGSVTAPMLPPVDSSALEPGDCGSPGAGAFHAVSPQERLDDPSSADPRLHRLVHPTMGAAEQIRALRPVDESCVDDDAVGIDAYR